MSKASSLIEGLKLIAREKARKIINHRHILTLAESPRHDDLYVVSFPKSGATWMDFLMANIHLRMSGDPRQVNFFNVHNHIPDIQWTREVGDKPLAFPGFRVMKSHAKYNPYYKNVIYIVRDPRDVLVSYYNFLVGLGRFKGSIGQLIRSPLSGIQAWAEHVRGWMEEAPAEVSFIFMQYEELKRDTAATLKKVYGQLGFELDSNVLSIAIENSSFERMKQLESNYAYGGREIAEKFTFMRKGKVGGWKEEMSEDDLAYIRKVAGKWMERFGYD